MLRHMSDQLSKVHGDTSVSCLFFFNLHGEAHVRSAVQGQRAPDGRWALLLALWIYPSIHQIDRLMVPSVHTHDYSHARTHARTHARARARTHTHTHTSQVEHAVAGASGGLLSGLQSLCLACTSAQFDAVVEDADPDWSAGALLPGLDAGYMREI